MSIEYLIKNELAFCEEMEFEKNEHGVFLYISQKGNSMMNLPAILLEYKDYLIKNNLVKVEP